MLLNLSLKFKKNSRTQHFVLKRSIDFTWFSYSLLELQDWFSLRTPQINVKYLTLIVDLSLVCNTEWGIAIRHAYNRWFRN